MLPAAVTRVMLAHVGGMTEVEPAVRAPADLWKRRHGPRARGMLAACGGRLKGTMRNLPGDPPAVRPPSVVGPPSAGLKANQAYDTLREIVSYRLSPGTRPVAFVVLRPGAAADEAATERHVLADAPAYQHPRRVWFLDAMPLPSTNKIDRGVLRRRAEAGSRAG